MEYEYDSEGRVTKETRPWDDGGKQMTRNVYAANSSQFYDTRPTKVYTDYEDATGKFLNLAVTDFTYEDSAEVERTTATTYAAGVNHQKEAIAETYEIQGDSQGNAATSCSDLIVRVIYNASSK